MFVCTVESAVYVLPSPPAMQAFRALSLLYHPDVVGGAADAAAAHAKFVRLSVAYHTLIDPHRRARPVTRPVPPRADAAPPYAARRAARTPLFSILRAAASASGVSCCPAR